MPIQPQPPLILFGIINVALSGNSISGDPVSAGYVNMTVSTGATAVFDVVLDPAAAPYFSSDVLYSISVTPLGTSNLTWAITSFTVNGFTITFRDAATGAATSPSVGFTTSILLQRLN